MVLKAQVFFTLIQSMHRSKKTFWVQPPPLYLSEPYFNPVMCTGKSALLSHSHHWLRQQCKPLAPATVNHSQWSNDERMGGSTFFFYFFPLKSLYAGITLDKRQQPLVCPFHININICLELNFNSICRLLL